MAGAFLLIRVDVYLFSIASHSLGICFDSGERPELRVQVPDGGLNIHNEPVAWSLRDGRVVYWSLLQLIDKRPDELFEANCYEAYREVAKEFGPSMVSVRVATTLRMFMSCFDILHASLRFYRLDTIAVALQSQKTT